jgi:hypothetical protein
MSQTQNLHRIFATDHNLTRARVSKAMTWDKAQDEWERLDNLRREGALPNVKFLEVRSADDPKYAGLPFQPWLVLTAAEKPKWVKLSRSERSHILEIGRTAGGLDDASHAIFTELAADPRWEHLDAVDISDYAWAAARFCYPREAHYN